MSLLRTRPTPPPWLPPLHDRGEIDRQWLLVSVILLAWGMLFFGYRGVLSVAGTAVVAWGAHGLARWGWGAFVGRRAWCADMHVLVLGMLGGLALPVTAGWWWPVVGGLVVGLSSGWVGRSYALRVHPVALLGGAMLLAGLLGAGERGALPVGGVLGPAHALHGDVSDVGERVRGPHPWVRWEAEGGDAVARPWLEALVLREQGEWLAEPGRMRTMLGRGELPTMEDVFIGAVPGGVGATAVALVILLGVYLAYRRLSSVVMMLAAGAGAVVTLLLMPVQISGEWRVVGHALLGLDVVMAVMWLAYSLLGTSLVWVVCVLAPMGMPMGLRGRAVHGLIVGAGGMMSMWWTGEPWAGYVGLLVAGVFARRLDGLR